MMFEKFTERSIKVVLVAQREAQNMGSNELAILHLVLGLLQIDPQGVLGKATDFEKAREEVYQMVKNNNDEKQKKQKEELKTSLQDVPFSSEVKSVLQAALDTAQSMGSQFISPEHIILGVLTINERSKNLLKRLGVSENEAKTWAMQKLQKPVIENTRTFRSGQQVQLSQTPKMRQLSRSGRRRRLDSRILVDLCRDLCAEVRRGKIDPVIGRSEEVRRTIQILARRQKNNPVLIGEAGVGKTAIAEGLAHAVVTGCLPDGSPTPNFIRNKRIYQLDLSLLLAGSKERGELEGRVKKLVEEASEKNVIIVVDEVHVLVGLGTIIKSGKQTGQGLDVSNLIKPALARGQFRLIGATTIQEYRKSIESDAALERRFQPVYVEQPNNQQCLQILDTLKQKYEGHHQCMYTDEALSAAVKLSERYITDRFLPDKAIDLMDEAGSRARITSFMARQEVGLDMSQEFFAYQEYQQVVQTKQEAIKEQLFEEASLLFKREIDLKSKLAGKPGEGVVLPVVDSTEIKAVLAEWTGIPLEHMSEDETDRYLRLGWNLRQVVLGQDEAVSATAKSLQRAASGLKDPKRPIATLMLVGPTGVGKTHLAKMLTEQLFGKQDALIRFDMSEYMERHTVSKLIGAPPGYVGYGEGGELTEKIRRHPYSVILFDELEKAHPDVLNILLQIMEDGRLTDNQGKTVNFQNCLLLLTSNVGSGVIAKGNVGNIGFDFEEGPSKDMEYRKLRSFVLEEMKSYFRPEFLNRLDDIIVFKRLQNDSLRRITKALLAQTSSLIQQKGITIQFSDCVIDKILSEGSIETMGARPLRRAVTRLVEDTVSEAILNNAIQTGDQILVDLDIDRNITLLVENDHREPAIVTTAALTS
eukprot:TRINITY_DN2015_c0_g5_i1.p1 TRINITY_DN2015_c0_g5~~TRINITY_DN2015_c0_g5_i1.p1  ORF type:complete len:871 (-),score=175.73 TRINITY_DN2015_c0_g5_i1:400-3012(-)